MDESYWQVPFTVNPTQKSGAPGKSNAVAAMSPGGLCWFCESPLPEFPAAVLFELPGLDSFYLVCVADCAEGVMQDVVREFPKLRPRLLDGASAFARFSEARERHLFALSNKTYEHIRRGGSPRLRIL